MLTTQVSAGEIKLLTNEIGEHHSDLNEPLMSPPVDDDFNRLLAAQWLAPFSDLASADSRARRASTPPTSFLYLADAWISESGSNSSVTRRPSSPKSA